MVECNFYNPFTVQCMCRGHFKPGFQQNPGYCNADVGGGRVGVRAGVNFWFPLKSFSLLWLIDTKLTVWVAYIKRQLGIATHVSVIKVKVTVTKTQKFSFRSITLVCFGILTLNLLYG